MAKEEAFGTHRRSVSGGIGQIGVFFGFPAGGPPALPVSAAGKFSNDWKVFSNGWKKWADFSNDWKNFSSVFQ
ncbi:MAG: hypothetical protein IKQ55_06090 [Kiritimatiellae bacterium]|nr:hypothetical protein [Kiritimatiellia bacterium]